MMLTAISDTLMKSLTILLIYFTFLGQSLMAQTTQVPGAELIFDLPNEKWYQGPIEELNGQTVSYFKREPIIDSKGHGIIPNLAFIVEEVDEGLDVILYSVDKKANSPFEVKKMFTHKDENPKINHKYSVGYEGAYKDQGEIDHTVYVVHLIERTTGVQVFCDITTELWDDYKGEFESFLRSIRAKE